MRPISRTSKIALFVTLGVCIAVAASVLSTSWIILNWREVVPLILGVIFFGFIIAGVILNTIFLVREVRRNEQQDSFLNAVTHELKTPITSIRLYLDTMRRRDISHEQQQQFLAVMSEDTDRLMATVEQVLKAGELGQRVRSQVRERVDMDQLVKEAVTTAMTRYHLDADAIHIDRRELQPGSSFAVSGNPEDLRTAVLNIIDNAVKYSPDGAHLTVVLSVESDAWVMVSVADQGLGIPQPQLKLIFRRFYRVPNRAILRVKGTGLGLFLVRSIARQHGGDAFAESAGEGHGSTIHLQLPRILTPGGTAEGGATV